MNIDLNKLEEQEGIVLEQRVIAIRRVAKVVAGGRRFRFTALVVVGTGSGIVGVGSGKAKEVPLAIRKATDRARKSGREIPLKDESVPFDVVGRYNSTKVVMRRARKGTGVIAGGAARPILDLAGVKNVLTKIIGSRNPYNVAQATLQALSAIRIMEERASVRGKNVRASRQSEEKHELAENLDSAEETKSEAK